MMKTKKEQKKEKKEILKVRYHEASKKRRRIGIGLVALIVTPLIFMFFFTDKKGEELKEALINEITITAEGTLIDLNKYYKDGEVDWNTAYSDGRAIIRENKKGLPQTAIEEKEKSFKQEMLKERNDFNNKIEGKSTSFGVSINKRSMYEKFTFTDHTPFSLIGLIFLFIFHIVPLLVYSFWYILKLDGSDTEADREKVFNSVPTATITSVVSLIGITISYFLLGLICMKLLPLFIAELVVVALCTFGAFSYGKPLIK